MKHKSLYFIAFFILIATCRKDGAVDSSSPLPVADDNIEPDTCEHNASKVTFKLHIQPILDEYCVSCHNQQAAENNGKPPSSFADYESARAWGYLMPGFRLFADLSTDDQQVIQDWIAGGLTEADYTNSAKAVLDGNCVSCHDADAPSRKDMPKTNFQDPEVARMMGSQMPQFGPIKNVPEEQQKLLEQWVRDGLPLE